MEDWQQKHIQANLPKLNENTCCSEQLFAQFHSMDIISKTELEKLTAELTLNGPIIAACKLYMLLPTKCNAPAGGVVKKDVYDQVIEALQREAQHGAANILIEGRELYLAPAKDKYYTRLPNGVLEYLQNVTSGLICVLSTPDARITCNKLLDNVNSLPPPLEGGEVAYRISVLNHEEALKILSQNQFQSNDLLLIELICESAFQDIIYQLVNNNVPVKVVVITLSAIVRNTDADLESTQNKITVFEDKIECDDLTPWHKNEIIKRLRGDLRIQLNFTNIKPILDDDNDNNLLLVRLIKGRKIYLEELFTWGESGRFQYYVGRKLKTRHVLSMELVTSEALTQNSSKILFYEDNDDHNDDHNAQYEMGLKSTIISRNGRMETVDVSTNQLQNGRITVPFIVLEDDNHFQPIYQMNENSNAATHLVAYINQKLEWKFSSKDLVELRTHVDMIDSQDSLPDHTFINVIEEDSNFKRVVFIFGSSGVGKTLLLSEIRAELIQSFPERVVVLLEAKRFFREMTANQTVEETLHLLACKNKLGRKILSEKLQSEELAIELLLDGLDKANLEGLSDDLIKLQNIVTSFKSIRVWVSSRRHLLEEVEISLNTLGYKLLTFDEQDQNNFLDMYWPQAALWSGENRKRREYMSISAKYGELSRLPTVIVDTCQNDCLVNPVIHMISQRFQEFTNDSEEARHDEDGLTNMHMAFSLEQVFPEQNLLEHNLDMEELLKVGLIESDSRTLGHSIHPIVADYFVAQFVFKLLNGEITVANLSEFIFRKVLLLAGQDENSYSFHYPYICHFLNLTLKDQTEHPNINGLDLGTAVLNNKATFTKLAHACKNEDLYYIFVFISRIFVPDFTSIVTFEFVLDTIMKSSVDWVKHSTTKFVQADKLTLQTYIQCVDYAMRRGNLAIAEYLLYVVKIPDFSSQQLKEHAIDFLKQCVSNSSQNSDCIVEEKIKIIKLLKHINESLLTSFADVSQLGPSIHEKLANFLRPFATQQIGIAPMVPLPRRRIFFRSLLP